MNVFVCIIMNKYKLKQIILVFNQRKDVLHTTIFLAKKLRKK